MEFTQPSAAAELALQELRRVVHGIRAASHAVERSCGVSGAQLFVLRELSLIPGASIRRLSEQTLTDASSVSVIVARLVARGLVSRARDPEDRRRSALSLTDKGSQLLARAPEPYQARLIAALRELSRPELHVLRAALARVSDSLAAAGDGAPLFFEGGAGRRERSRGSRRG
ncbi:MAG: MarR family transcriptional regulator [Myxococcales bacterium]|nr:MarR family transcriptional regulator [Myxococcales bacterium]MCB9734565.1 MarR family transcriptional regulator [Deltaproteobacteria bacterium]